MAQKFWQLFVTSALLIGNSVALAVPFNSIDPRSMGMGGAGVAVGDTKMAPFFNPALLTVTNKEDDFSLALPIIGVRAYDPSDFSNSLDNFQSGNYVSNLDASIATYNANPSSQNSSNIGQISTDISALSSQLASLSDKPIQAELGAGLVVGIPSKSFGGAFYANGWQALGGVIRYKDDQLLQDFVTVSSTVANTLSTSCGGTVNSSAPCVAGLTTLQTDPLVNKYFLVDTTTNPASPTVASTFNANNGIQSSVDIRGVGFTEIGLALAHEYGNADKTWGFGITPKMVKVTLFDYSVGVNNGNTDNATNSDYTAKYSHFNFDLGLAKEYGNGWRTGFVVKNVIPHNYDFKNAPTPGATPVATGATISLKPQTRIGISHSNSWSTAAMDLDLTANDPAGLEKKSQYLALGGELNAWSWAQIRAGYRANLKDSARNVTSLGLGLGPFDLTVASSSKEFGAAFAFGFTF